MYFKPFKKLLYDYTIKSDADVVQEVVVDLSTRVSLFMSPSDMLLLTNDYTIAEGETPEVVAHKIYGDVNLHWVVMHVNNIADLSRDWPLTEIALKQYVIDKYGVSNINAYHHTEKMPEMIQMGADFIATQYGVGMGLDLTNIDYEARLNDLKRFIKIVKPIFLQQYVKLFNSKLQQ